MTSLAIDNLGLKVDSAVENCRISEYPTYMGVDNIEKKLFKSVDRVDIQPINAFPEMINDSRIDDSVKKTFDKFKHPLSSGDQIIIPIKIFDFSFNAAFKITSIEPAGNGKQFIFKEETEVYMKRQPVKSVLVPKLQQRLANSVVFPRFYTFKSYPNSEKLDEFMRAENSGPYSLSSALVYGPMGIGKRTLIRRIADDCGVPLKAVDLYLESEQSYKTMTALFDLLKKDFESFDCLLLDGFELAVENNLKIRSIFHQLSQSFPGKCKKLICCHSYTIRSHKTISEYVLGSFDVVEAVKEPGRKDIKGLVDEMFELIPESTESINYDDFVGFSISDFANLLERYKEAEHRSFTAVFADYKSVLKFRKSLQLNSLEVPKVSWDEVAGLAEVKTFLQNLKADIEKRPRPTGLLLHGPPGTGKTLIAKALATQSRFTLLPVKGPEVLSPYIGESEASLREIFTQAHDLSPCIIFFDELDALVPRRGDHGDSVGVSDRMVATFMTEMDKISGLNSSQDDAFVFVIGATNRPDLIDPALMRKGRFDISILLDAPETDSERAEILRASCKKMACADDIDFLKPFKSIKMKLSPAQIASIAKTASKLVLARKIEHIRLDPESKSDLLIDPITTDDLIESVKLLLFS